jgi:hypothetical protein
MIVHTPVLQPVTHVVTGAAHCPILVIYAPVRESPGAEYCAVRDVSVLSGLTRGTILQFMEQYASLHVEYPAANYARYEIMAFTPHDARPRRFIIRGALLDMYAYYDMYAPRRLRLAFCSWNIGCFAARRSTSARVMRLHYVSCGAYGFLVLSAFARMVKCCMREWDLIGATTPDLVAQYIVLLGGARSEELGGALVIRTSNIHAVVADVTRCVRYYNGMLGEQV